MLPTLSTLITRHQALTIHALGYSLGGLDLSGADLTRADLSAANLSWANLTRADLTRADLTRAYLTRANLSEANLYRANLSGAYLTQADLREADLTRADLRDADLSGADLREANLTRANLTRANLSEADLGAVTRWGRLLRLLGACSEATEWCENSLAENPGASVAGLIDTCPDQEWVLWLTDRIGGRPTVTRCDALYDFLSAGVDLTVTKGYLP